MIEKSNSKPVFDLEILICLLFIFWRLNDGI